ncbi:hypothetical protein BJX99DRAFT_261724 [Aspergillus californicus]
MRFIIAAFTSLVAISTALLVDVPGASPLDLEANNIVTLDPTGDARVPETYYLFLANNNAEIDTNPCIFLGTVQRGSRDFTILAGSVSEPVQGASGYVVRTHPIREQDSTCRVGEMLAETAPFIVEDYRYP